MGIKDGYYLPDWDDPIFEVKQRSCPVVHPYVNLISVTCILIKPPPFATSKRDATLKMSQKHKFTVFYAKHIVTYTSACIAFTL